MNENIDLTKILNNCPQGWHFYSSIFTDVTFLEIDTRNPYPVVFLTKNDTKISTSAAGRHIEDYAGECTIFPSRDQRDWSKFTAPWYKKGKFDPKYLKPFDKVIVRDVGSDIWKCTFFSSIVQRPTYKYRCVDDCWACCIPYNDCTKHLVGTKEEAPEYYKYWDN